MFVEINGYGRYRQPMGVEEVMSALRRVEMGGKGIFFSQSRKAAKVQRWIGGFFILRRPARAPTP
jgi:hypothetical protein